MKPGTQPADTPKEPPSGTPNAPPADAPPAKAPPKIKIQDTLPKNDAERLDRAYASSANMYLDSQGTLRVAGTKGYSWGNNVKKKKNTSRWVFHLLATFSAILRNIPSNSATRRV